MSTVLGASPIKQGRTATPAPDLASSKAVVCHQDATKTTLCCRTRPRSSSQENVLWRIEPPSFQLVVFRSQQRVWLVIIQTPSQVHSADPKFTGLYVRPSPRMAAYFLTSACEPTVRFLRKSKRCFWKYKGVHFSLEENKVVGISVVPQKEK